MDTSYLNWVRGNRITAYAGLAMETGYEYKFGPDYTYLEIPALKFQSSGDKDLEDDQKGSRNQHLLLLPACVVNIKGQYRVEVEPNPELSKYGAVQPGYYIHPGTGEQAPGIYMNLHRNCDISELSYAVRLYLRA